MRHDDLKAALRVFGLGERATLKEIKARYREPARQHHPDGGNGGDTEEIYRVIEANRGIIDYPEAGLLQKFSRNIPDGFRAVPARFFFLTGSVVVGIHEHTFHQKGTIRRFGEGCGA